MNKMFVCYYLALNFLKMNTVGQKNSNFENQVIWS